MKVPAKANARAAHRQFRLGAELLRNDHARGDRVAEEEDEESRGQDWDLPSRFRMGNQIVQRDCVVQLEDVAGEEKGKQEAETPPHPAVEALDGYVHVVTLPERLQPVQNALLVAELKILNESCVKKRERRFSASKPWPKAREGWSRTFWRARTEILLNALLLS